MNKNLYGLFFYKLQYTSFFSIMQRVSGFFLIFAIFLSFFFNVFNYTFFFNFSFNYLFLFKIFSFLILFFFIYHFINGLRIYYMSSYYFHSFSNRIIGVNNDIYAFLINYYNNLFLSKSNIGIFNNLISYFLKNFFKFYLNLDNLFKSYFIKSKLFFIFFIFLFFIVISFFIFI